MTRAQLRKLRLKDLPVTLLGFLTLLALFGYLGALGLQEQHHTRVAALLANPAIQADTNLLVANLEGTLRH